MIVSFDAETWLIASGRQLPPAVCISWCELTESAAGLAVGRSGVVTAREGCDYLLRWLDGGATIVGANTAFDALVSVVTVASQGGDWKRLLKAWVEAYEQGRVRDVFVRQKLLDIAAFGDRYEERSDGSWITHGYNLQQLSKRLTGRVLSKPENEDDHDHWRLRFSELEGVPIAEYPKAAYDYALEDSIATAENYIVQERERTQNARIRRNFPGRDPFVDEIRQTMACLPLKAMSAYGLRTDGPSVERFAAEVQEKIVEVRADLVDAGLVRPPEFHKMTDAVVAYIRAKNLIGFFEEPATETTPYEIKLHKARYLEAWRASQDVNMWRLANYREISKDPKAYAAHLQGMVDDGLVEILHTRDTKAAAKMCVLAYAAMGETAPRTDTYSKKKHGPLRNEAGEILLNLECVSLDSDACSGSGNPILEQYSAYTSLAKTVANDIPMLRAGVTMPVHTRFDELKKTGRTGSSKPNVQNLRRLPGIRECFIPRPGHVFIDSDFEMLELHTLAQVCQWNLGFSTLGEALNGGKDPHLMIAAAILNFAYDYAKAHKKDPEVDNARTAGKGCFHPDTEVLTASGWIKVGALRDDSLVCSARFDGERTVLEYAPPIALTERDWDGDLVHVKNEGIDLRVTPDHRMVGWEAHGKKNELSLVTCVPEEVPELRYWPNAGMLEGVGVVVDERLLRLAVAAQADGHIEENGRLRFGFLKQRKVQRLLALLGQDDYARTNVGRLRVDTIRLSLELSRQVTDLLDQKRFPFWWTKLTATLREFVLDEAQFWDGCGARTQRTDSARAGYSYYSTDRQNAEVLQTIATITNRKTRLNVKDRAAEGRATMYELSIKTKHRSRGGHVSTKRIPYVGKVFCLKTHNDSVVVRDGGVPVITRQCNFGAAGGLSAKTFVVYAWTNYRIRLTLARSQELLKIYHDTWKEIPSYFRWVRGHEDPYSVKMVKDPETGVERKNSRYNIVQPWSQRLRASCAYCEACNTPFQGLGSDVAKLALWLVWKASIGLSELGEADPLYGCHPVNFVHDSITTEVEEHRAHAAAIRQKELMEVAGRIALPDVPVRADVLTCRQLSKKASQRRALCHTCGARGDCPCKTWNDRPLEPWDLGVACRETLAAFLSTPNTEQITTVAVMQKGKDAWKALNVGEQADVIARVAELALDDRAFAYLKLDQWPSDVARDAVGEAFGADGVGKAAA